MTGVDLRLDPTFRALVAAFPLDPIRDAGSYQAAITVLDHLFDRGNRHPGEQRYFHALARRARAYEQSRSPTSA